MYKKTRNILILLCFGLVFLLTAAPVMIIRGPVVVPSTSSPCPSFYNGTNVILSWDGDHTSGTNYICNSSGTAISGTNTNLTVSTSYGEGGSNGSFHDSKNERIDWTQTAKQYFDESSAQTIWMRIYIVATPDQNVNIFGFGYDNNNHIGIEILNTGQIKGSYKGTTLGTATAYTAAPSTATWVDIAYSWDRPNQDHAAYGPINGWEEDLDELTSVMDYSPTVFSLGNNYSYFYQSSTSSTNPIYVTQWALVDGYKAAKPW